MAELVFGFVPFLRELKAMSSLAHRLLERQTIEAVLPMYRSQVENLRTTPRTGVVTFEIPEDNPVQTKISDGDYEASGRGTAVYAKVSSIWEVTRLKPRLQRQPADHFQLAGKASTRVRICQGTRELAMWRMEIGDEASPGCHFHVQVLGEADDPPFPKLLPIPRLPSLLFTPVSVLEFVLGELFQQRWEEEMLRQAHVLHRWAPVQKDRLERLLDWHASVLDDGPSPWWALKRAKPREHLFVDRSP